MKKTKLFVLAAILCAVSASCNRTTDPDLPNDGEVTLTLDISTMDVEMATKSSPSVGDEAKINTLDIYVYDMAENLASWHMVDTYMRVENYTEGQKIDVKTSPGSKRLVVVANQTVEEANKLLHYEDFWDKEWLYEHNSRGNFLMTFDEFIDLYFKSNHTVKVTLKRLVAKVQLRKVILNIAPQYGEVKLKGAYLHLVPKVCNSLSEERDDYWQVPSEDWLDEEGYVVIPGYKEDVPENVVDMMTCEGFSGTVPCSYTWESDGDYTVYPFPNRTYDEGFDVPDLVTKFVIELEIAGYPTFYTIGLPGLSANCFYDIKSVTINRIGAPERDYYVGNSSISATAEVNVWEDGEFKGLFCGTDTGEEGVFVF